jgi:hypothetical protein
VHLAAVLHQRRDGMHPSGMACVHVYGCVSQCDITVAPCGAARSFVATATVWAGSNFICSHRQGLEILSEASIAPAAIVKYCQIGSCTVPLLLPNYLGIVLSWS